MRFILTGGECHDQTQAEALMDGFAAQVVIADKGYDDATLVGRIQRCGAQAVIPSRSNRKVPRTTDWHLYRERHLVECFIGKIKHYRRVLGVSIILCKRSMLEDRHSVLEDNRKAIECCPPIFDRHRPARSNITKRKIEQFQRGFICRKRAAIFNDLSQTHIRGFHCVGRIDDAADFFRISQERHEAFPVSVPRLTDRWILLIPLFSELRKPQFSIFARRNAIDFRQVGGNFFALFVADEIQRMSDHMDNAKLDLGFGKDGFNRFRKAFESINASDKDVTDSAIL